MEPFVDFGLFEILFVLGLTAAAVNLYSRKFARIGIMAIGVLAPLAMVVLSSSFTLKAIAFLCVVTALVNTYVLIVASQNPELIAALRQSQVDLKEKAKGFRRKFTALITKGTRPLDDARAIGNTRQSAP